MIKKKVLWKCIENMAKDLAILRREIDYEWGEYNEKDYNTEILIKDYIENAEYECGEKKGEFENGENKN